MAVEMAALPPIAMMTYVGGGIDLEQWKTVADQSVHDLHTSQEQLNAHAGTLQPAAPQVNWNAPAQVLALLSMVVPDAGDTREETLQRLAPEVPLAAMVLAYRKAAT